LLFLPLLVILLLILYFALPEIFLKFKKKHPKINLYMYKSVYFFLSIIFDHGNYFLYYIFFILSFLYIFQLELNKKSRNIGCLRKMRALFYEVISMFLPFIGNVSNKAVGNYCFRWKGYTTFMWANSILFYWHRYIKLNFSHAFEFKWSLL